MTIDVLQTTSPTNRFVTISADLSSSINVEKGTLTGHYDPVSNPAGTRIKAAIQEAGNASTAIGLVGQSVSLARRDGLRRRRVAKSGRGAAQSGHPSAR